MRTVLTCLILSVLSSSVFAQESSQKGQIQVFAPVSDTLLVIIDNDFQRVNKIVSGGVLDVEPGERYITVSTSSGVDYSLTKSITAGKLEFIQTQITRTSDEVYLKNSLYPRYKLGANVAIQADEDADIIINGIQVGKGSGLYYLPKTATITAEVAGARKRSVVVEPEQHYISTFELNVKPNRSRAMVYALLPGVSQFYKGQIVKGGAFTAGVMGSIILAAQAESRTNSAKSLRGYYESVIELGLTEPGSVNPTELLRAERGIERQDQRIATAERDLKLFLLGAAAVYSINILDGFISKPKGGYSTYQTRPWGVFINTTGATVSVPIN